jgi:hypothetical protein
MTTTGMNLAEVRHLAEQLDHGAERLRSVVSTVDGRVTHSSWVGPQADRFKHEWWPGHRQMILQAADHIQGLARSARNNADEQERASGTGAGQPTAASGKGWTDAAISALGAGAATAAALGRRAAQMAPGILGGAGRFAQGLNRDLEWISRANSWAEIANSKFLRNPNLPVSNLLHDVLGDGRIKFIGSTMTVISVAAHSYETYQDFRSGDYYEGTLDAIDTIADPFRGAGPVGWLATGTIETWTDVARQGREVDWSEGVPWGSMNPFDADDRNNVLIPTAKETGRELVKILWEDWAP